MNNQSKRFKIIKTIVFLVLVSFGIYFFEVKKPADLKLVSDNGQTSDWSTFDDTGFSIKYPNTYVVDKTYQNQTLGPGKEINGVSFTIPKIMTAGTNLSEDTHISIEQLPNAINCSAEQFIYNPGNSKTMTENGVTYSYADSVEPAAGNIYEEKVYALANSSPCTAIHYLVHSGNIYNYTPGDVKAFDEAKLLAEFDAIRATLVINK